LRPWRARCILLALFVPMAGGQAPEDRLIAAIARHAELFQQKARLVISDEMLVQRSYRLSPSRHLAIGAAAEPVFASFLVSELVSQYSVGSLRGDKTGSLLEIREIVAKDGRAIQTPEAARRALQQDISSGETAIRKKLLVALTELGLVDVATDYGLILLAFTKSGMSGMELTPSGSAWIGTDEAIAYEWRQKTGGLLEFRGRTVNRRAMRGLIWVRQPDGLPLRISASIQHEEPKHLIRDDATVDYVLSSFGCVTPASVVHRHYVDDKILTENLYLYAPFRLFSTDSNIQFTDPEPKR
jgi:hypothetical protein